MVSVECVKNLQERFGGGDVLTQVILLSILKSSILSMIEPIV